MERVAHQQKTSITLTDRCRQADKGGYAGYHRPPVEYATISKEAHLGGHFIAWLSSWQ
jgi:hypothetical protein